MPTLEKLPAGVSVLYDSHSHVHAFQFSRDASDIYFRADKLFPRCRYFPYEFSLFVTMRVTRPPRREECLLSLFHERSPQRPVVSVVLSRGKLVFRFKEERYKFKTNVYRYGIERRGWWVKGVCWPGDKLVFRFKEERYKFQTNVYRYGIEEGRGEVERGWVFCSFFVFLFSH